jgi:hypothetical protein
MPAGYQATHPHHRHTAARGKAMAAGPGRAQKLRTNQLRPARSPQISARSQPKVTKYTTRLAPATPHTSNPQRTHTHINTARFSRIPHIPISIYTHKHADNRNRTPAGPDWKTWRGPIKSCGWARIAHAAAEPGRPKIQDGGPQHTQTLRYTLTIDSCALGAGKTARGAAPSGSLGDAPQVHWGPTCCWCSRGAEEARGWPMVMVSLAPPPKSSGSEYRLWCE